MTKMHVPSNEDRIQVEALASFGIPHDDISLLIGVSPKTLRARYRHELDVGSAKAIARVAQTLFKKAIDGDTASAIFWLKTRARWRETHHVDHTTNGESLNRPKAAEDAMKAFISSGCDDDNSRSE